MTEMSILIGEVSAWVRKYERLRELLTAELGLADVNDIRAAEDRGYRRAIADLCAGSGYEDWCATTGRHDGSRYDHAAYLEAIADAHPHHRGRYVRQQRRDAVSITNEVPAPIRTPNEVRLQAEVDHLAGQIDQLAEWFRANAPERIIEGGAVDVAIATLEVYRHKLRERGKDIVMLAQGYVGPGEATG